MVGWINENVWIDGNEFRWICMELENGYGYAVSFHIYNTSIPYNTKQRVAVARVEDGWMDG